MYGLPFASINPVTLDAFPEDEPELESKRAVPKKGAAYRVIKLANGTTCLAPGYSLDEHTLTFFSELPNGSKFQVEMPHVNFRPKLGSSGDFKLVLHFDEHGNPCFVASNGECVELNDCIDMTQLRLTSMPEITH